jgi:ketosteroid isomerase-like protein
VSEENVELVRRAFQVGDLAKMAAAFWHPEIEYVEDPRFPGASLHKGRDAVVRCFRSYLEVLGDEDDIAMTLEEVFDAGEQQVPLVRFRGHARTSRVPFEHLWGYVVEVRDERIAYLRAYYEPAEAIEAAGLRGKGDSSDRW